MLGTIFSKRAQPLGFASLQPFEVYPWQAFASCWWLWLLPPLLWVGGSLILLSWPPAIPTIWWGLQFQGLSRAIQSPHLPYMAGRGLLFQVWLHPLAWLTLTVVGIQPGNSSLVIGYQVDEFSHACSAVWFLAHSHINPGFTGKVPFLNHFAPEQGCELFIFGPSSCRLCTGLEFHPHSFHADIKIGHIPLMSLRSLLLPSQLVMCFYTSKLQLAPCIRSHKLWYQAMTLLSHMSLATKMSTSKLIC